jgi:hypothetical protein
MKIKEDLMKLKLSLNTILKRGQLLTLALVFTGATLVAVLAPTKVANAAYIYKSTTIYSADIDYISRGLYESRILTTPNPRSTYDCNGWLNDIYIDRGSINGYGDATSQANFRVKYYPNPGTPFRDDLGWEFITRHNTAPDHVIGTCVIPGTKFSVETDRRMDSYRVHY